MTAVGLSGSEVKAVAGKNFFRKKYKGIGEVDYKLASSREELEGALALIYEEYSSRGFILPQYYKSRLRITPWHLLSETMVFVGLRQNEVVATTALLPDLALGLPLDTGFEAEVNLLRRKGRKLCEGAYLAIKSKLFDRGVFSMFNFTKLDFLFTLFKLPFQYLLFYSNFDDWCIETNPKYMIFKYLPFEMIGEVKYFGYDRVSIKRKAAAFKRMDLKTMRQQVDNPKKITRGRLSLYDIFVKDRLPKELFEKKWRFSQDELRYFFVEKSDVLKTINEKQKAWVRSAYGLNPGEVEHL